MKTKQINGKLKKLVIVCVCLSTMLLMIAMLSSNSEGAITLRPPSFAKTAAAAELNAALDQVQGEAGITAYTNVGQTIDLSLAKDVFRTVELETADYLLGSVPVNGYAETQDVHVYISKDGWIVAYYMASNPAAKSIDMVEFKNDGYTSITTKQETTINLLAQNAGVAVGSISFYDFRNPNANEMLLIAENSGAGIGNNSFVVNIPRTLVVYERSYYIHAFGSYQEAVYLDGIKILARRYQVPYFYDVIDLPSFAADIDHTFSVDHSPTNNLGFAVVYRK